MVVRFFELELVLQIGTDLLQTGEALVITSHSNNCCKSGILLFLQIRTDLLQIGTDLLQIRTDLLRVGTVITNQGKFITLLRRLL